MTRAGHADPARLSPLLGEQFSPDFFSCASWIRIFACEVNRRSLASQGLFKDFGWGQEGWRQTSKLREMLSTLVLCLRHSTWPKITESNSSISGFLFEFSFRHEEICFVRHMQKSSSIAQPSASPDGDIRTSCKAAFNHGRSCGEDS